MKDIKELSDNLSAPLGQLISEMGRGVAEAQQEMDKKTLQLLEEIYQKNEDAHRMLQEIGYRPNWYHIPEAEAEINVSLSVTGDYSESGNKSGQKTRLMATPMNATYQNSFGYEMKASSRLKFKIVPVPEPVESENRKVMPNVVEMTAKEAVDFFKRLDIEFEIYSSGGELVEELDEDSELFVVDSQNPQPGVLVGLNGPAQIFLAD